MTITLHKQDGKYGIKDNEILVVPYRYDNPNDVIYEWEYFERLNTDRPDNQKFLPKTRTHREIDEIVQSLKTQI